MILIGVLAGLLILILLLDTVCRLIDRGDYLRRLRRDNAELLSAARRDRSQIRRLQTQLRTGGWVVTSEAERRCAELELELHQLQKKIEIKDAMLRAMLPAEKGGKNDGHHNHRAVPGSRPGG